MDNKSNYQTCINLKEMRLKGLECTQSSLIHKEQLEEVCAIIKERMEYGTYDPEKDMVSINDVISIFARRGAGKTTFVKTLGTLLSKCGTEFMGIKRSELMCIDVIEPNQIYKKENFMIRFLASIQSEFEKAIEGRKKDEKRRELKEARDKLYEALPVIDGVGKLSLYSDWDDSDYVADKYIQLAINAKDLERRFHIYINTALKLVEKKALLFILDDCDVNIEKTFEALETIRLYFTSPQVIVIMTGDTSLYGMAIRRNYWKFFSKEFLEKDCPSTYAGERKRVEYRKMVNRLETQYLQKMVKAEHRIVLDTLYEKYRKGGMVGMEGGKYSVQIRFSNGEEMELREIYVEILENLDLVVKERKTPDRDIILRHLLRQPFRNQYRLLSAYDEYRISNPIGATSKRSQLTDKVLKVFEVYINQCSADNKFLMGKSSIYSAWMMKFLIDNHIATLGSSMLPNMEDDNLNNAMLAMVASYVTQMQEDKSMIFDFLIRVSFISKALHVLDENGEELDEFVHICYDSGVDHLLGNVHAYLNSKMNLIPNLRTGGSVQNTMAGICVLSKPVEAITRRRGDLIKLIQLTTVAADMTETYMCSFYRIFSCLAELLRISGEREEIDPDPARIETELERLAQRYAYIEPYKIKPPMEQKAGVNGDRKLLARISLFDGEFFKSFSNWAEKLKKAWVTPYSLDRLFSRAYHALNELDSKSRQNPQSLGMKFSDYVLAFWNACLVEECIDNGKSEGIMLGSDKSMAYAFIENYRKVGSSILQNEDSFTRAMIECPLLRPYVDPLILEMIINEKIQWEDYASIKNSMDIQVLKREIGNIQKSIEKENEQIKKLQEDLLSYNEYGNINKRIEVIDAELSKKTVSYERKMALLDERKKWQEDKQNKIPPFISDETIISNRIRDHRRISISLSSNKNSLELKLKNLQMKNKQENGANANADNINRLKEVGDKPNELSVFGILTQCLMQ